jgi:CRISPR system Cascade subunit CasD
MPTLLLRLCGPMQSWGTRSRFVERDTELEPSKSGVFGMLCAAAGIPRTDPIPDEWLALRMGVRCDRPGHLSRDYHTAGAKYPGGIAKSDGGRSKDAVVSNRHYLSDADFLVGLEGEDRHVLENIEAKLKAPCWQISLGRKSFLPAWPVHLPGQGGFRERGLLDALRLEDYPLLPLFECRRPTDPGPLRFVIESKDPATNDVRQDQPRPDSFATRRFDLRRVETHFLTPGGPQDE